MGFIMKDVSVSTIPPVTWDNNLRNMVLTVYIIILIIGLPANLLSFYTFIQKIKQKAKPIDILLLSLNLSDLIFLLYLWIRITEAVEMDWNIDPFFCPFSMYIFLINIYNSTLHLASISVERFLGITFAVWYKLMRNPQNAIITSVIIWVFNLAHCSIVYYIQLHMGGEGEDLGSGLDSKFNTCYWNLNQNQLNIVLPVRFVVSIVVIFLPLTICCICYFRIITTLLRLSNVRPSKRLRAVGLAMATLLLFMVCFLPFGISHVLGFIKSENPRWRVYALLLSSCNSLLDPFIFYFSSKSLHEKLTRSIQFFLAHLHTLTTKIKQPQDTSSSGQIELQNTSRGSSEERLS